jgi:hypothetical protein
VNGSVALPEDVAKFSDDSRPGLLHNMCARPRTAVTFEIRPIDAAGVARFRLPDSTTLAGLTTAALERELDAAWAGYAFTGAALVFPWHARHSVVYDRPVTATDRLLVVNVLARARAAVLLGGAPAVLDAEYLLRDLASDDPRLVALAEATGAPRIGRPGRPTPSGGDGR